ncbi:hypothetical protein ACXM2N_10280 [Corynebacterium sp. ZY180755]
MENINEWVSLSTNAEANPIVGHLFEAFGGLGKIADAISSLIGLVA